MRSHVCPCMPVPYSFNIIFLYLKCTFLITDINDVLKTKGLLQNLEKNELRDLFRELGLTDSTVQNRYSDSTSEYADDLIRCWILGKDYVLKKGEPTWENLKKTLKKLNHHGIARYLVGKHDL